MKFSDLNAGSKYVVQGYDGPINSKYGFNYFLKVSEINSDAMFEMWSTNLISEYISNVNPTAKFTFTVHERDNTKYPMIDGYKKVRKFTMLA